MESQDIQKKNYSSDDSDVESIEQIKNEKKKSFWRKIPFIGLILILVKNILAGISDIVIKKMTDIDPITLIFFRSTVMLSIEIPWSVVKDHPPFPAGLTVRERLLQVIRFFHFTVKIPVKINLLIKMYSSRLACSGCLLCSPTDASLCTEDDSFIETSLHHHL